VLVKHATNLYLHLYNGRTHPDEELDDWGTEGPTFGPYDYVQTTYGCHVKCGGAKIEDSFEDFMILEGEYLYYDGIYYGDWAVFSATKDTGVATRTYFRKHAKPPLKPTKEVGNG